MSRNAVQGAKPISSVTEKPKNSATRLAELLASLERLAGATRGGGTHVRKQDLVTLVTAHGGYVRPRAKSGPKPVPMPMTVAQLAARPKPPTPWKSPYTSWGRDEVAERLGPTLRRPRRLD